MPKYLSGVVKVFVVETFANSPEEGDAIIKKWAESEAEDLEPGVKSKTYKLCWSEFNSEDPTEERNRVLAEFLNLMQKRIPGMPEPKVIVDETPQIVILPELRNCPRCKAPRALCDCSPPKMVQRT